MFNQERILEFQEGKAILSIPKYSSMGYDEWYELVSPVLKEAGLEIDTAYTWKYLYVIEGAYILRRDDTLEDIPDRKNRKVYTVADFSIVAGSDVNSNYPIF